MQEGAKGALQLEQGGFPRLRIDLFEGLETAYFRLCRRLLIMEKAACGLIDLSNYKKSFGVNICPGLNSLQVSNRILLASR